MDAGDDALGLRARLSRAAAEGGAGAVGEEGVRYRHDAATALIADALEDVPLDALRAGLARVLEDVKRELTAIINRDYASFVTLSTQLEGFDTSLIALRQPADAVAHALSHAQAVVHAAALVRSATDLVAGVAGTVADVADALAVCAEEVKELGEDVDPSRAQAGGSGDEDEEVARIDTSEGKGAKEGDGAGEDAAVVAAVHDVYALAMAWASVVVRLRELPPRLQPVDAALSSLAQRWQRHVSEVAKVCPPWAAPAGDAAVTSGRLATPSLPSPLAQVASSLLPAAADGQSLGPCPPAPILALHALVAQCQTLSMRCGTLLHHAATAVRPGVVAAVLSVWRRLLVASQRHGNRVPLATCAALLLPAAGAVQCGHEVSTVVVETLTRPILEEVFNPGVLDGGVRGSMKATPRVCDAVAMAVLPRAPSPRADAPTTSTLPPAARTACAALQALLLAQSGRDPTTTASDAGGDGLPLATPTPNMSPSAPTAVATPLVITAWWTPLVQHLIGMPLMPTEEGWEGSAGPTTVGLGHGHGSTPAQVTPTPASSAVAAAFFSPSVPTTFHTNYTALAALYSRMRLSVMGATFMPTMPWALAVANPGATSAYPIPLTTLLDGCVATRQLAATWKPKLSVYAQVRGAEVQSLVGRALGDRAAVPLALDAAALGGVTVLTRTPWCDGVPAAYLASWGSLSTWGLQAMPPATPTTQVRLITPAVAAVHAALHALWSPATSFLPPVGQEMVMQTLTVMAKVGVWGTHGALAVLRAALSADAPSAAVVGTFDTVLARMTPHPAGEEGHGAGHDAPCPVFPAQWLVAAGATPGIPPSTAAAGPWGAESASLDALLSAHMDVSAYATALALWLAPKMAYLCAAPASAVESHPLATACRAVLSRLQQTAEAMSHAHALAMAARLCDAATQAFRPIPAAFRMSARPVPTTPSPFTATLLQPLRAAVGSSASLATQPHTPAALATTVIAILSTHIAAVVNEIMSNLTALDASLQWLRKDGAPSSSTAAMAGGGGATPTTDTHKIGTQLLLDVRVLRAECHAICHAVPGAEVPAFCDSLDSAGGTLATYGAGGV